MNRIIEATGKYLQIGLIDCKRLKEYEMNFYSQLLFLPVRMLIFALLWSELYKIPGNDAIFDKSWLISYYIILCIVEFFVNPFCVVTYELMNDVREGTLDMIVSKPVHYFLYRYFNKSSNLLIGMICLLGWCFFQHISIVSWAFVTMGYFILVSTILMFTLFGLIGLFTFLIENVLTLRDNLWNLIKLLSGAIIPLEFYPSAVSGLIPYLPFQYIYAKPISVLLNPDSNYQRDIVISLLWVILLAGILSIFWKKALQRYSSQGG